MSRLTSHHHGLSCSQCPGWCQSRHEVVCRVCDNTGGDASRIEGLTFDIDEYTICLLAPSYSIVENSSLALSLHKP